MRSDDICPSHTDRNAVDRLPKEVSVVVSNRAACCCLEAYCSYSSFADYPSTAANGSISFNANPSFLRDLSCYLGLLPAEHWINHENSHR